MTYWVPIKAGVFPIEDLKSYDITIECPDGTRLTNVGIYRKKHRSWEILIDRHHFYDAKVVAWKNREDIYRGE